MILKKYISFRIYIELSKTFIINLGVNRMEVHERMKAIQTDSDTKVKALALQFGVSEHSMGNYLNGKRSIPYDILVKFARHYNVTTDYLLGLTDSPAIPCPLSDEEQKLIEQFRTLSREQKELILQSIALMCRQNERG